MKQDKIKVKNYFTLKLFLKKRTNSYRMTKNQIQVENMSIKNGLKQTYINCKFDDKKHTTH